MCDAAAAPDTDARFRLMAEAAPVLIWLSNPDRVCTYFNAAWLEFTGRSLEEELAHDWVEDVHPEDRADCLATYGAAFRTRRPFRAEYRLRRRDGAYRWILDSGRPHYLPDGRFAGYISAGLDISERKEADLLLAQGYEELERRIAERTADLARANAELRREIAERERAVEALRRRSAELERSNAELAQFAYVASHELQEPLRAVAGCVQLLNRHCQDRLDERAQEYMRHAVEGATRMQALINDLLSYARVTSAARTLIPTDGGEVLRRALRNLETAVTEAAARVTHDDLPTVGADPTQLLQLFQNLVGNALKFRGPRPPEAHLAVEERAGEWRFSVRDNGIGIEPQYSERIFGVFQRLHKRTAYPGTGIGLALCKKIVERHGGRIWI